MPPEDRWFRLLWWLLRTVRCDFAPCALGALPAGVREDATLARCAGGRLDAVLAYALRPHAAHAPYAHPPPVLLYHGSPVHNMHSILKCGLRPFSGTALMGAGEAYGAYALANARARACARHPARSRSTHVCAQPSPTAHCS